MASRGLVFKRHHSHIFIHIQLNLALSGLSWLYLRGLTRPVFVWPIVAVSMVNRDLSTPVSVVYQDFSMSGLSWLYLLSMETSLCLAYSGCICGLTRPVYVWPMGYMYA